MIRRAVLLGLLLAACAAPPAGPPPVASAPPVSSAPPPAASRLAIPPLLQSCPIAPLEPAVPRTIEAEVDWAHELRDTYAECAYRLKRLVDLVEGRP